MTNTTTNGLQESFAKIKEIANMNPKWEEQILATPRATLFNNEELAFQGTEQDSVIVDKIISNLANNIVALRRGDKNDPTPASNNAEINTDLKQPIPYVLVKRGNEIYVYERLSGGGEKRLQNKLSIGIGGHQNKVEEAKDFNGVLMTNLERELEEELNIISNGRRLTFIGLINDDSNEVGRVHLGILAVLELSSDAEVSVRETDSLRGFWSTVEDLRQDDTYNRLESWSQIAVDIL